MRKLALISFWNDFCLIPISKMYHFLEESCKKMSKIESLKFLRVPSIWNLGVCLYAEKLPTSLRIEEWVVHKLHTWDSPTGDSAFLCWNDPKVCLMVSSREVISKVFGMAIQVEYFCFLSWRTEPVLHSVVRIDPLLWVTQITVSTNFYLCSLDVELNTSYIYISCNKLLARYKLS